MPGQDNYQFGAIPLNMVDYVTKKTTSSRAYFRYLLSRTLMMFKYSNLPDTIDPYILERYLQMNGFCCITEAKGSLYCFNGSWGGEQDVYYRPTKFIIANPHISQLSDDKTFTKECTIYGDQPHDAVLMRNDFEWQGLAPLISRYSVLFTENCITVRTADIMLRILALLSASSDKAKKSAEAYLSKLEKGELGVIADSAFMESLKMQSPPSNNGSYLTQFIELQQYLKGSFYNELGLRANYNMKREAIGEGESTLDTDALLPLCQCMLQCRRQDIAEVNSLFGTNISVEFNSAWLQNEVETSLNLVSQLSQISAQSGQVGGAQLGEVGSNGSIGSDGSNGENGKDGSDNETDGKQEMAGKEPDDKEGQSGKDREESKAGSERSGSGSDENGSSEGAGREDGEGGEGNSEEPDEDEGAGGEDRSREDGGENGGGEETGGDETGGDETGTESQEEGELEDVISQLTEVVAEQVEAIMDDPEEGGAENGMDETQDPED